MSTEGAKVLGINGLGRIGKLSLWHHAGRKFFDEIVITVGRKVGTGLSAIPPFRTLSTRNNPPYNFLKLSLRRDNWFINRLPL